MRKVLIGTPCYDGRLDVWYTNSLMNTIKIMHQHECDVTPIWVSFDALIQRARNDTLEIMLRDNYDDIIWIDSDIEWEPRWFYKLLDYEEDLVGGTYRKKGDIEEYVFRRTEDHDYTINSNGLMRVSALGTGFVKMSRKACQYLWDNSPEYIDRQKNNTLRKMAFDVRIQDGQIMSEDIWAFETLRKGGFQCWLDTTMTCNHTGPYKFKGDFLSWLKNGKPKNNVTAPALNVAVKKLNFSARQL